MTAKRKYRNTLTGMVELLTPEQAAVFPRTLELVADDAKPYVSGMFKPGYVGEHDNPEPPTDAELAAQAVLDATLETNAPNSKVAREARAELKQAEEAAEKAAAEAQKAAVSAGNEE